MKLTDLQPNFKSPDRGHFSNVNLIRADQTTLGGGGLAGFPHIDVPYTKGGYLITSNNICAPTSVNQLWWEDYESLLESAYVLGKVI